MDNNLCNRKFLKKNHYNYLPNELIFPKKTLISIGSIRLLISKQGYQSLQWRILRYLTPTLKQIGLSANQFFKLCAPPISTYVTVIFRATSGCNKARQQTSHLSSINALIQTHLRRSLFNSTRPTFSN